MLCAPLSVLSAGSCAAAQRPRASRAPQQRGVLKLIPPRAPCSLAATVRRWGLPAHTCGGRRAGRVLVGASGDGDEGKGRPDFPPGRWIRAQRMTPKRWLLVVLGGVALLVLLQRLALLGLVGLERLLIGGLIALENAAVSALTTTARTAGLAGVAVAIAYAAYIFFIAEDTSKK
mmetsp:Transcript_25614/g.65943  ORF Transcript_25614/g.65943 Transcript_25614/m.65943 type:complete len:175 (-) Transcript_25614:74-598(-)|eukprot:jgi/Tetstr1/433595/TSEL_022860.t1